MLFKDTLPTVKWLINLSSSLSPLTADAEDPGRRCRWVLNPNDLKVTSDARTAEEASSSLTDDRMEGHSTAHIGNAIGVSEGGTINGVVGATGEKASIASNGSTVGGAGRAVVVEEPHHRSNRGVGRGVRLSSPHTSSPSAGPVRSHTCTRLPQYWSVVDPDHTADGEELSTERPAFSFTCLIGLAILSAEDRRLTVGHIYEYMARNFPYFQTAPSSWRNSVRHVLSRDKFFHKPPRNGVKGTEWEVKGPMLELLVGDIAEGQTRVLPATAKHIGLPDLRESITPTPPTPSVSEKGAFRSGGERPSGYTLHAAAAAAPSGRLTPATPTPTPSATRVSARGRACRRGKGAGAGAAKATTPLSTTTKTKTRTVHRKSAQRVRAYAAAAAAADAAAAAAAVGCRRMSLRRRSSTGHAGWGGLVPLRFDLDLNDFAAETSGYDSSGLSESFGSDACDNSDFSLSDSHSSLAIPTLLETSAAAAAVGEGAFAGDGMRRVSTYDWPVGMQAESIISTFLENY